jgi:hypothetical protein
MQISIVVLPPGRSQIPGMKKMQQFFGSIWESQRFSTARFYSPIFYAGLLRGQGDQMSLWKKSPNPIFVEIISSPEPWKK